MLLLPKSVNLSDASYKKELWSLLKGKDPTPPQVFVRGNHIGDVEKIKKLNEAGEMGKLLEIRPFGDYTVNMHELQGLWFVPCLGWRWSGKVYGEKAGKLRGCWDCNKNGPNRSPFRWCSWNLCQSTWFLFLVWENSSVRYCTGCNVWVYFLYERHETRFGFSFNHSNTIEESALHKTIGVVLPQLWLVG